MIYVSIMILLTVLSYVYDYRSYESGRKQWIVVLLILFILLAGCRYRIGTDTVDYIHFYSQQNPLYYLGARDFDATRFGPGFVVLMSVFKTFTDDFTFFQLFHSIIVNGAVFWFLYKYSKHFFFALLIFFVYLYPLFLFQQLREAMAVSVFLLAWRFFNDGKWGKWYLASALALMFHLSSMIMLVLPLFTLPMVRNLFIFGKRTILLLCVVLVGGIAVQSVFFKYLELYAISDSMAERASTYSKDILSGNILNGWGMISQMLQYVVYPMIAMYFIRLKRSFLNQRKENCFIKWDMMVIISMSVAVLSIPIAIFSRYLNYFYIFAIVYLSDWAFSLIPHARKMIRLNYVYWIFLFMPMFAAQINSTYFGKLNKSGSLVTYMVYYPYASCFDQTIDNDREKCYRYLHSIGR